MFYLMSNHFVISLVISGIDFCLSSVLIENVIYNFYHFKFTTELEFINITFAKFGEFSLIIY